MWMYMDMEVGGCGSVWLWCVDVEVWLWMHLNVGGYEWGRVWIVEVYGWCCMSARDEAMQYCQQ